MNDVRASIVLFSSGTHIELRCNLELLHNFKLFEADKKCIWNSVAIGLDCFNNGLPVVYRFFAIHCRFWEIYLWLFFHKRFITVFGQSYAIFYWNKSTIKLSYSGFYRASRKTMNKEQKNSTYIFRQISILASILDLLILEYVLKVNLN